MKKNIFILLVFLCLFFVGCSDSSNELPETNKEEICCECLKPSFKLSFNEEYYPTSILSNDVYSNLRSYLFNENGTGVYTIYSKDNNQVEKKTGEFLWTYVGVDKISILSLDIKFTMAFTFGEQSLIPSSNGGNISFSESFLRKNGFGDKIDNLNN